MDALNTRWRGEAASDNERGWAKADFSLTMAFQPILNMSEGTIFAHEALVRGANGESAEMVLSKVSPDTQSRFDQLCRTRAIELAAELDIAETISINFQPLPANNLERGIIRTLRAAESFHCPLTKLLFEIIDHDDNRKIEFIKDVVEAYRSNGLATALDNFGNGSIELNDLEQIRPDVIKMDRGLTRNVHANRMRQIFVSSVVDVCKDIGCTIVAQGVETPDELEGMLALGIEHFQGYLLARPSFESIAALDMPPLGGPSGAAN